MSRVSGGAGIKYQEFEDGWIYEIYTPVDSIHAVVPRGKTAKILFVGCWLAAFNEDGINYLTIWVLRKDHEAMFPQGPPSLRIYDEDARETAASKMAAWKDPNETMPGVKPANLKLVELARLVESRKGTESP